MYPYRLLAPHFKPLGSMGSVPVKRVCIFCGSRHGSRPAYTTAARTLAAAMVKENIGLVYGGV
jgi:predicted Rossmann-fold nucleotide-binding protein